MPPSDVSLVFLVRILRIQNRHVAIPQELHHLGPPPAGKISRFVLIDSILRRKLQFETLVRFVVWHVCDRSAAGKEPIGGADARMIRKLGLHFHLADVKLHLLKFFDRQLTLQFMQAHREKGRLHLRGQDRAETRTRSFIAQDPDQILAVVDGGKERQTLDVIPVRVGNEKSQLDRFRSQLLFQRETETTNPGARVEHDNFAVCPHFYTTGIASIPVRPRPRHGKRAAHAPQLYSRRHRTEFLRGSRRSWSFRYWWQEPIDGVPQDFPCNRLDQKLVRAGFQRARAIYRIIPSRHHDDLGRLELFPDGTTNLKTIRLRHQQVA